MDVDVFLAVLWTVINGAISGIIASAIGFFKARKLEKFENEMFLKTVLLGAILGGIAGYFGWGELSTAEMWLQDTGLMAGTVFLVECLVKAIMRRSKDLSVSLKKKPRKKKTAKKPKKKAKKEVGEDGEEDTEEDEGSEEKTSDEASDEEE